MPEKKYTVQTLFTGRPASLKLFRLVRKTVRDIGPSQMNVTKTQVSFKRITNFAYVWLPQMWVKRPENSITLAFDLDKHIKDKRISEATLARPGRWVHHIVLERPSDLDSKVKGWLKQSYRFGAINHRKKKT